MYSSRETRTSYFDRRYQHNQTKPDWGIRQRQRHAKHWYTAKSSIKMIQSIRVATDRKRLIVRKGGDLCIPWVWRGSIAFLPISFDMSTVEWELKSRRYASASALQVSFFCLYLILKKRSLHLSTFDAFKCFKVP